MKKQSQKSNSQKNLSIDIIKNTLKSIIGGGVLYFIFKFPLFGMLLFLIMFPLIRLYESAFFTFFQGRDLDDHMVVWTLGVDTITTTGKIFIISFFGIILFILLNILTCDKYISKIENKERKIKIRRVFFYIKVIIFSALIIPYILILF
jgi:hypothetical protein